MSSPRTLFNKVWDAHLVRAGEAGEPSVLYVDLHLIHEVTSPQAFTVLRERGLRVHRPDRTLATMDHSTPTIAIGGKLAVTDAAAASSAARATCTTPAIAFSSGITAKSACRSMTC